MSFGAVVGILFWTPALLNRFTSTSALLPNQRGMIARLGGYVWGLLAVSLAATLFVLPLSAYYFHRIPLVTLPANLTVLPILGFLVLPAGLAGAASLPLFPSLAQWLLHLAGWGVKIMSALASFWSSLPFSSPWVVQPNGVEMVLLYTIIFVLIFRKRIRWVRPMFLFLGLALCADVTYWVFKTRLNRDLRVTYLDVGQANCALVELPFGKRMLIDGGGFSSDQFDVGKMVVAPFLWRSKIGTIDYLVLTHPQADHMNGLRFIASAFTPIEFWWNGETVETDPFRDLMEKLHVSGSRQLDPSQLSLPRWINGVFVEILHPGDDGAEEGREKTLNLNDRSLVIRLSYRGISFLFPGDIEKAGEKILLTRSHGSLRSHVLLAPHHGSRSSCTEPFIRSVDPGLCVISCGASNPFRLSPPRKSSNDLPSETVVCSGRTNQGPSSAPFTAVGSRSKVSLVHRARPSLKCTTPAGDFERKSGIHRHLTPSFAPPPGSTPWRASPPPHPEDRPADLPGPVPIAPRPEKWGLCITLGWTPGAQGARPLEVL